MILKWLENKSKHQKVCKPQADISFIKDYKQSHNKTALNIPIVLGRVNVLLGIFRRRQRFSERRTIIAVDSCRRLINNEIEGFFEQKERVVNNRLLTEIIYGEKKSYSDIFGNKDLEKIYRQTENVILHELFERFNNHIVWQLKKGRTADDWVSNIFNQLKKYQNTKMRTILITSYIEALSRKTLNNSIESLIENSLISKLSSNIDISTLILKKLDIDSSLETMDLMVQLSDRIEGALDSIKIGLIQDINDQLANIFYKAHDTLINSKIEMKINLLEEEIAREEIYETNLMEA
ncbi:hypothetical protein [Desulfosporosinus sp. BG]|uniref:hypothetical protein n=1 Tax=Desulfosporosinus sp. BG TaxID=1633135 RepID=UPI00083B2384|nr:hypothetical protein [Desulfosporosinus sp. BG]ODA42396.1 hypothetical protein DSBG_0783 [Desulfosporosinus sp. BG]